MKKAQKFFISTILTLIFCLGAMGVTSFFASKNEAPYTQEYIDYLRLSDDEKKLLEVVPEKYPTIIDSVSKEYQKDLNQYANENTLEDYYNLKDEITIYTENQSLMGICWAYASVKSLETFLALNYGEYWNFSEGFVAYARAKIFDDEIDVGGNWLYFMEAFNNYGILAETFLPYEMMNSIQKNNMQYYSYLEEYADTTYNKTLEQIVLQVSQSGVDGVKAHIKQNGSVYLNLNSVAIKSGTNGTYVSNAKTMSINHAVSLIGWDDNFSTSNFPESIRPNNNGAFLALNSYGPQWGNSGVFYISYEDIYVTNGLLYGFKNKSTYAEEVLQFQQISSPTSTYSDDDMTNMFHLGDPISLDYQMTTNLQTAPNVEITVKKNGVDLTENFALSQTKNQTQTKVTILTAVSLEAGTYTIEFKHNNNIYIRNFVIISGAEITSITANASGPISMFNTINGQTKTFSAGYFESTYGGYRRFIDLYIFVEKKYSEIQSISINSVSLSYLASTGKYSGSVTVNGGEILDMLVTTTRGTTEIYKIFVITNVSQNLFFVNYNLNGGINSPLNPTRYDTEYNDYYFVEPTKPNYVFDGWYAFEIRPESKITHVTNINWGNMLLVAKWKLPELTDITITFRNELGDVVEESQGLIYGYTVDLTANFDYLQEDNLILNWYINSIHYDIYDLQTSINLKIQVGTFTIECVAIKNGATLASQETSFTAEKKVLLLSWQETNFVYNGQNQSPSASVTGLIGTDTYPLNYVYELENQVATNSILAGEYKVAVTNLSNQNYVIEENFEKTYTINKANLTISWQETNFVYNGQNQSPSASVTGLIGTDTYPLNYVYELENQVATNSILAGEYKVAVTNLSNQNYVIEENFEKTYTINKANLTISWQETNFVYNGQNQSPSASVTGLIGTDTYPLNYVYELENQVATNSILAGEYKVAVTNLSNQNYVIEENFEKTYTIDKAVLTLIWEEVNFVYNGQNQVPTASVTGLIGTDTYPLNYVYKLENQVATNSILAGEYKVAVTNLSNQNYVIEENFEKTYTIDKAVLTLIWQETNFVYNGQNQSPSASLTGLIGTDTYPLNYVYELENQVATNSILAGEYKVAVTNLSNQNYVIEENFEKTYTIDKASLTINVLDIVAKYSDGLIGVEQKFELVGVIYNSEMSVIVTTNAIAHKAGSYEITVQNNTHQNYNITINSGTYTILEGKTFTYELPSGEKLVHYINQGEQPPSIDTIYKPEFTIVSLKEIKNENGNITYQVIEVALLPIILISAPILLVILFSIMSIMRKRRKRWQY